MNRPMSAGLAGAFVLASAGLAFADVSSGSTANVPLPDSPEATRMTHALNLLEAQGYGDFSNFRAEGKNFAATVTRNGRQFTVVVDPDTDHVTPKAD